jgi:hypothetical protein
MNPPTNEWQDARLVGPGGVNPSAIYIVKTNGGEWRDSDLHLWRGHQVIHAMRPECVRGRPILIAEVINPLLSEISS